MPGESLNFDIVNQRTCGSIITQCWNSPARAKMRLFSVVLKLSVIYNWEKLEFFKITGEQFRIRVCEVSFPSSRRLVFCRKGRYFAEFSSHY